MSTPRRVPYQYVVLRCVPRADREEFLNVGVVLYCEAEGYLCALTADPAAAQDDRLRAAFPGLDVAAVHAALGFVEGVCAGAPETGAAGAGALGTRFGFLKAPRSTVVRPGPVHGGLTDDPAAALRRLRAELVGEPQTGTSSTAPTA